jgi:phage terminase large subunit GpA-like protein
MKLEAETLKAILAAVTAGLEPLKTFRPLPLSAWAEQEFHLSAEASHQQGRWKAFPFQPGWMDAFSNDDIEEVDVRKSKRVGYTKTLVAFIAYNIAHRKRKQALWQPTDDDRDSFVKSEVDPMLRDVKAVQPYKLPGKEDTLKLKSFLGSVLHTLGGKAARAYRRITVAVSMLDEASAFDTVVEKSVNPVEGARGRLEGAPFPKLIVGSTPRIKGIDHIEDRERHAQAVMRYQIACLHCGAEHPLQWGSKKVQHGMKGGGLGGDTGPVRHVCPHCRGSITQGQYLAVYGNGAWVSDCGLFRYGQDRTWRDESGQPCRPPRHVAFVIWAAYSPQRDWSDIVREFLEAKQKAEEGENGSLMTFVNETLGEYWEEKLEKADEHELQRRAESYPLGTVPWGGLVLVAGVDVQDDRFEVVVWAIGRGEEMWAVDYTVIPANPADEREWEEKLDPYLKRDFVHAGGQSLQIEAAGVDTGGHYTHQAYNFCRKREARRVYAVKGDSQPTKMVKSRSSLQDVNHRGKVLKRGVRLWFVGTDTAKDLLHGRLQVTQPGPGYVHFSRDLPPQFYSGLTAEVRAPSKVAGGVQYRWVNPQRRRNEPLDCTVYGGIFCAHMLNLHTKTAREWDRLEAAVQPATGDLFTSPTSNDSRAEQTKSTPTAAPAALVLRGGRIGLGGLRRASA